MTDMRMFPFHQSTGYRAVEGTKDGAIFTADWIQSQIMRGNGYVMTVGAFSTPIVGGGNGTIIDLDQPEFLISVPSGRTIFPFRIAAQTQSPLLATDSDETEILVGVDRTQALVSVTSTAETAFNLRTDNISSSTCTATSAHTADIVAPATPVLGIELDREVLLGDVQGTPATALWTRNKLLYAPQHAPMLVGPCSLLGYWGGTVATNGFAQVQWIELATADFPTS